MDMSEGSKDLDTHRLTPRELEEIRKKMNTHQSLQSGKAADQKHYTELAVQPVELMQAIMTHEEWRGYLKGNIIKYAMRQGHKEGEAREKDREKMEQYTAWLHEFNQTGKTIIVK